MTYPLSGLTSHALIGQSMHMRAINPLSGTSAQEAAREAIAANVRVELARAKVSGTQMAAQIGLASSTFSRRMAGDVCFGADEIAAIATILSIPTDILLIGAIEVVEPVAVSAA